MPGALDGGSGMSRKVATLVYDRRIGSAARKAVLAYFADRADDYGRGIYSSKQTIADETELGRSTVIRVVNEFVEEGILKVAGSKPCRNGATTLYDIDLAAVESLPAARSGRRDQSQSGTSINRDQSQSGTRPVPERDPKQSQSGTQTVLEPSLNREAKASQKRASPRSALMEVASSDAVDAFIEMRAAKRAKLTLKAAQIIAGKIRDHPDPDAVLLLSVERSWTSVYPESLPPNVHPFPSQGNANGQLALSPREAAATDAFRERHLAAARARSAPAPDFGDG